MIDLEVHQDVILVSNDEPVKILLLQQLKMQVL